MADLKISQLPAAGAAADTDIIPIVDAGGLNKKLTLSQIWTQLAGAARTIAGAWTFTDAITVNQSNLTTFETLATFKVSDDATSLFRISNGSSAIGLFAPLLEGTTTNSSAAGLNLRATSPDGATTAAVFSFNGRASGAALATRPVFSFDNYTTRLMTLWSSGLMIGSGTSTAAAAKLEVQDTSSQVAVGTAIKQGYFGSNGTIGTHVAWQALHNGTNWVAKGTAASAIRLGSSSVLCEISSSLTDGNTFTPTEIWRATATGFGVGATPAFVLHGANSTGKSQLVLNNHTAATSTRLSATGKSDGGWIYGLADFDGTNWKARSGAAAGFNLTSGAAIFYADTGLVSDATFTPTERFRVGIATCNFTSAPKLPSYTTGTRPSASTLGAGAVIYDTTISKPIFSNGTSWLDAAGAAA